MTAHTLLVLFAGKGGVGKTTCAAAHAVAAAHAGRRVVLVSTDPAHSLGDVLGTRVGRRMTALAVGSSGRLTRAKAGTSARLSAIELDAPRAYARWLAANRQPLGDIVEHGTWLDRGDADSLVSLPMPGVDELAGFLEIVRLAERSSADVIVVDTAPTGHMLRLVNAPEVVGALAEALDRLQGAHRAIRAHVARSVARPEAADLLIERLAADARHIAELFRDPSRAAFHWVALPERMSLEETCDGFRAFERAGIPIARVIVNRVTRAGPSCRICDRLRAAEAQALAGFERLARGRPVRILPAMHEPRGGPALLRLAVETIDPTANRITGHARPAGSHMSAGESDAQHAWSPPDRLAALHGARLLLFGGKGGVGKTTCAAATALRLARERPLKRVLLVSTDPAHSLADVLAAPIGSRPGPIRGGPPNLHVQALDASAALRARRPALDEAIEEIGATFGADRLSSSTDLVELAPPGIDELLAVMTVSEAVEAGAGGPFDVIVVDTAPTGHALRLLDAPELARAWLQVLMRLLLKYRSLIRPGRLAGELIDLSRSARRLYESLRNPDQARFIVVTRAADVVTAESIRLLEQLGRRRIPVPAIVVNGLRLAPGACPVCRMAADEQQERLADVIRLTRRSRRQCAIILAPLMAPPPVGPSALETWSGRWSMA